MKKIYIFSYLSLNLKISYQIASLFHMYIDMGERIAREQDRPSLIIEDPLGAPQNIHFLGGLRVTKPTIRLACPSVRLSVCLSVCLSVRQHFACKHDNSTNINRIGPKLIPWMYLKSVLVKFEDG